MAMLKHFDVELLIGQLSYKQKADIYVSHGYDTTKCSTLEKKKQLTNNHHMGMCTYLHLQCQFVYFVQSRYIKCLFSFCSGHSHSVNSWIDGDLKLLTSSMLLYNWQFVTQRPSVRKV